MEQSAQWVKDNEYEVHAARRRGRYPFLKFLFRYPIFLLAFGPPVFRSNAGIDATKGVIDVWSFFQVALLAAIAIRAMYRLASAESILIPKQVRSILKLAFLLGLLFLASAIYSPSRFVSAAYSFLYFLGLICMVEFIADVYKYPPDWIQCLFHLRMIALLLLGLTLLTLLFDPTLVLSIEDVAGIRLRGGAVAPVTVICPIIAIISAYSFLHGLESRGRSVLFLFVGLTSTLITQSRGAELALLLSLAVLGAGWASTGKRPAYFFISSFIALMLSSALVLGVFGGDRIWYIFNRGESAEGIASASGRTPVWQFVYQYCLAHPQGMGYIVGFRMRLRETLAIGADSNLVYLGNAHNVYVQVLADAGWLALAIYILMLVRIILLGWRFVKKSPLVTLASISAPRHALGCAMILLVYCCANATEAADFSIPLKAQFYIQDIIIAIILGISARMLVTARARYAASYE